MMRVMFLAFLWVCVWSIPCQAQPDHSSPMDQGIELLTKGEYDSAAARFREAIQEGEDPEAYLLLGMALNRTGEYSRALKALERARELETASAEALFEIGRAHMGMKNHLEALKAFREDLAKHPWRDESHLLCGVCLYELGEYREAIESLRDSVSREITNTPQAYYYIGLCQLRLKEYREAEASLRRASYAATEMGEAGILLPDAIRRQIEGAAEAAKRAEIAPRNWYASVTMGFGHTDNVLSLSKDTVLPADISSRSDESLFVIAQGGHRLHQGPRHALWAKGTVYANHYLDLDDFDVQQYSPQLELYYTPDRDWRLRSRLSFTHYRVDEDESSNSLTFSQSVTRAWSDRTSTSLDYSATLTAFHGPTDPDEDREGNYQGVRGYQRFRFTPHHTVLDVGAGYGWNNTDGKQFDSDAYRFFVSLAHDFFWDSRLSYDLSYSRAEFDNLSSRADPAFSVSREDDSYSPSVTWLKRINDHWSTVMAFRYLDNDSNIAAYDFDKYSISASVTYSF